MPTWQIDGKTWALTARKGVVYVGGTFGSVRPPRAAAGTREVPRRNFAAFNSRSGRLLKCAPRFTVGGGVTPSITALALSPKKRTLYVGGRFSRVNGKPFSNFVALRTSNCRPRPGYPAFNGIVRAIAVDGPRVFVGGDFTYAQHQPRTRLGAMSLTGRLLPWSPSADDTVRALTVAPSGQRIYAGGGFGQINGGTNRRLVALNTGSGAVAQSFPGWLDGARETVTSLAHDSDYFYVGVDGTGAGQFDGRIAADVNTGTLHWRVGCKGATQAVLPYRGVLYSGSHSHDCSLSPGGFPDYAMDGRQHLLAERISDRRILPWFPDTNEGPQGVGPHALAVAAGQLWVGGEFTSVNKRPQQGLIRFPGRPDTGAPKTHKPKATSPKAGTVKVTWNASWDRDDGKLIYKLYRAGRKRPVDRVRLSSRFWDRPTMTYRRSGLRSGAVLTYRVTVSDGENTSPRSKGDKVQVR